VTSEAFRRIRFWARRR